MYTVQNEDEHKRLLDFVRGKNEFLLDQFQAHLRENIQSNLFPESLRSASKKQSKQRTSFNKLTDKQSVQLYDNLELFSRESFPLEVMKKLRRLDKEKDKFAYSKSVYDRLYKESTLKPLVMAEKELVIKDLEANKRLQQIINDGNILRKLNLQKMISMERP